MRIYSNKAKFLHCKSRPPLFLRSHWEERANICLKDFRVYSCRVYWLWLPLKRSVMPLFPLFDFLLATHVLISSDSRLLRIARECLAATNGQKQGLHDSSRFRSFSKNLRKFVWRHCRLMLCVSLGNYVTYWINYSAECFRDYSSPWKFPLLLQCIDFFIPFTASSRFFRWSLCFCRRKCAGIV